MKEKFYIFLDIDGVLWDWAWLKERIAHKVFKKGGAISKFNPSSMLALNYLIEYLQKRFEVNVVISSSWRHDLEKIKNKLLENGLKFSGHISKTPRTINPFNRGMEILSYLKNKDNKENYVVLDDETFDFSHTLDLKKLIKTNIFSGGLNMEMVKKFLYKFIHTQKENSF
ncbi:MAG: HAD domain-containing protein [Clostridia bacterium]